jgi:hypothetical protein
MLDLKKIYEPILTGKENFSSGEVMCYCPFHSHNNKTPSMSINTKTGQFKCFSCSEHGGAVSFYAKTRNVTISQALKDLDEFNDSFKNRPVQIMPQLPKVVVDEHDYSDYLLQILNESLLHESKFSFYGQKLYELRGITYPAAVACCIGYDPQKGWIFPTFKYPDNKCIGHEVRKKDFTLFDTGIKCYRSKGGANCLSVTYSPVLGNNKKAYICEGAIDSIFMYQYLYEQAQKKGGEFAAVLDTILTPSNGVNILPEVITSLQLWNDFDEIVFILDNDKAGNEAKAILAAMEHGGKFKFFSGLLESEDFENYYKRKLVK